MIHQTALGDTHFRQIKNLKQLIDDGHVQFGGNKKLKIYGLLDCRSGKRMKVQNRVFFGSITEAAQLGYRPCGHCMRLEYAKWKKQPDIKQQFISFILALI